jgi:hypothetical protein
VHAHYTDGTSAPPDMSLSLDMMDASIGTLSYAAITSISAAAIRDLNNASKKSLPPTASSADRDLLRLRDRRRTPAPFRQYLDWRDPINECGQSLDSNGRPKDRSRGDPRKSNARADRAAGRIGVAGRAMGIAGAAFGVVEICQADDKARATFEVAGSAAGGAVGGWGSGILGAFVGGLILPGIGAPIGALIFGLGGSAVGGHLGGAVAGAAYDAIPRGGSNPLGGSHPARWGL